MDLKIFISFKVSVYKKYLYRVNKICLVNGNLDMFVFNIRIVLVINLVKNFEINF